MKQQDWEIKQLADVVEFQRGLTYSKNDEVDFSDNIVLRSNNVDLKTNKLDFTELKYINPKIVIPESKKVTKGSLMICTANGSKNHLGKVALIDDDYGYAFGGFMGLIKPKGNLNSDFLFHIMTSENYKKFIGALSDGANINNLKFGDLGSFEIPVPPLSEQERIVAILEEAFAAIGIAKANAQQNLKNAKELFENTLQSIFSIKGEGWEEKQLGDFATFRNGINYSKVSKGDKVKIVGVKDFQNSFFVPNEDLVEAIIDGKLNEIDKLKEGDILAVRSNGNPQLIGRTLLATNIQGQVSHSGFTIRVRLNSKNVLPNYLCRFLKTQKTRKELVDSGNGVGIRSLNQGSLSSLKIPFPTSIKEQEIIIEKLDLISEQSQRLEAIYQKKLEDLEELKKSILQKAFAGELTSSVSANVSLAKVIPLQKIDGISATDLQAGITALALQKHIEKNQLHSFHHVKAEKIVHLSEYILNIDLERNPVKDAAGPNDFPHAKKVESRAKKAGFYTVFKNGEYYDYRQGRSIQSVIQKMQNCLNEKADTLLQIIDILIPMNTQQAEIVATAYAAWNNLLLNNTQFTDEDIVTEARENWHKEKLKIPREKFVNAIEWMKKNELLIPKGNGKTIIAK